jgi:ribosomal subunit interface protein
MQLTVKGKQLDVGDALRTHVADSLNTVVGKYFSKPMEATVVLSREAHLYTADIQVRVGRGIVLQCASQATEPYPAFDTAADKLDKRLRRYKSRLRGHHANGEAAGAELLPARYQILEAEKEEHHDEVAEKAAPMVIAEMQTHIDTLTVSEAVMRMELGELPALMFRNSAHGGLNMVYRRTDGNVGWVDPGVEKAGA